LVGTELNPKSLATNKSQSISHTLITLSERKFPGESKDYDDIVQFCKRKEEGGKTKGQPKDIEPHLSSISPWRGLSVFGLVSGHVTRYLYNLLNYTLEKY